MAQRLLIVIFFCWVQRAQASQQFFGTVRGMVHDPQPGPVPDSEVLLKESIGLFAQDSNRCERGVSF
jgi:hypothetical protein